MMCWCNPSVCTPCCGGLNCHPPQGVLISNNTSISSELNWCKSKKDQHFKGSIKLQGDCIVISKAGVDAEAHDVGYTEFVSLPISQLLSVFKELQER